MLTEWSDDHDYFLKLEDESYCGSAGILYSLSVDAVKFSGKEIRRTDANSRRGCNKSPQPDFSL